MFPIRDHNPSGRTPWVVYVLIAANVAAFLLEMLLTAGDDRALAMFFYTWGVIPAALAQGELAHTVLTSMFVHGGWLHLGGNMLFLWVFGDNLEDMLGPVKFLLFYLASGIAAAALQVGVDPGSTIPMVGASGAIAGVMGGYLLLFPKARVDVLIFLVVFVRVLPVRAWIVLGAWIGLQLVQGFAVPSDEGGVAYFAHIGGFFAGLALMLPFWLLRGGPAFWARTEGHPPHPGAEWQVTPSRIPRVRRIR